MLIWKTEQFITHTRTGIVDTITSLQDFERQGILVLEVHNLLEMI